MDRFQLNNIAFKVYGYMPSGPARKRKEPNISMEEAKFQQAKNELKHAIQKELSALDKLTLSQYQKAKSSDFR